jgi:biofilm PGA synthesis N-glycosyltransferase PgaC
MSGSFALYGLTALILVVLAWCYSVYYLLLSIISARRIRLDGTTDSAQERFHVLVPCYEEDSFILAKLENLAKLDYPKELFEVIVVDGGSMDKTPQIAADFCQSQPNFRFVLSLDKGKIPQLNYLLQDIADGIIVNTDVDGEVEPDALSNLAREFANPQVGCVGGFVTPKNPSVEDDLFWRDQNAMRLLESHLGHASALIAVFFAFRRTLLERFPEDVVADDVHVAFSANTQGFESRYSEKIRAYEMRSGQTSSQMFIHKLRKFNANMRETSRFLPHFFRMKSLWKIIFLTKLAQHWLVPPLLVILIPLFIASFVRDGFGGLLFWGGAIVTLMVLQKLAQNALKRYTSDAREAPRADFLRKLAYLGIFHLVLITGFFRYFVVRQSSTYKKVEI